MATRLLVIHKQLVFAVTIKQALEQTGGFAVHPFTKAEAAFDFLRDHPQDIALVDFNLPGRSGPRIVQQLRSLQPDIAVIVTPQLTAAEMHNLGVQNSLASPFTARDLLPLLQNVLDEVPLDRPAGDLPLPGQMTTNSLGDASRMMRQQPGTTQNLGEHSLLSPNEPAQTHRFDIDDEEDKPQTKILSDSPFAPPPDVKQVDSERSKPVTRPFIDNPPPIKAPINRVDPFKTRIFEESEPAEVAPPQPDPFMEAPPPAQAPDANPFQTRRLPDAPEEAPNYGTRILPETPPENLPIDTRRLEVEADSPQTRDLGRQEPFDPFGTRRLDSAMPSAPPEFSSLDEVLQSFGMAEPPPDDMDTPAVPTKDSDALRQFIATNSGEIDPSSFDDVLGAIDPEHTEAPKKQRQVDFEGLVRSMQRDEPQRRLPDRQQQQLLDFVLTTGMDSVLKEIEKTKTGLFPTVPTPSTPPPEVKPLPKRPPTESSFQKLAEEEPPLPSLEENGTVSDLLVGISDSNFRDVLALLNDSSVEEKPQSAQSAVSPQSDSGYFDDFLQATTIDSDSVPVVSQTRSARENFDFSFNYDEDDDGATVAGVVLQSTQKNTALPGEFSLDQLMADINERLTTHKLKVRPLPSWDMDTTAFHAPVKDDTIMPTGSDAPPAKRRPNEPSFLPEMFPPGEIIPPVEAAPPELPALEPSDAVSEVWTTRASEPSLENIAPVDENAETVFEPGYFDETVMNESVTHIDTDMFSGILDENAVYDESPRYDGDAESSSNQTLFDWGELDGTAEIQSSETAQEIPEAVPQLDSVPVDDFDTHTLLAATEPEADEFTKALGEADSTGETGATNEWDGQWDTASVQDETVLETTPDAWEVTEAAQSSSEMLNEAWDVPATPEQAPTAAVEAEPEPLSEEARIAQLALNLTQVSLELSAEGTILTRNNQIIAVAGHLSQQDTSELGVVIHNDWGTGGQGSRLRFITLPSNAKEYMLYSTGTDDDLILSMIFAGSTPLRVIRQQGQRLIKALSQVSESQPATEITPAPSRDTHGIDEVLEPYSYVWLVRDPENGLNSAVAQSITAGLMTQLRELNWKVEQLHVQNEYVYLYASVPGDAPSYSIIRELKHRATSIARKQDINLEDQDLWADSYLVLSPGRELAPDEIQEFVDFQRMM